MSGPRDPLPGGRREPSFRFPEELQDREPEHVRPRVGPAFIIGAIILGLIAWWI